MLALAIAQLAAAHLDYGFLEYCYTTRDPGCIRTVWTDRDLAVINSTVSGNIETAEDASGLDAWTPFPKDHRGDCDDDAATKRAALMALGFPPTAMRFEVGKVEEAPGQWVGHIVLVATIGGRDLVLDRKTPNIVYAVADRPYEWRPTAVETKGAVLWRKETAPAG